MWMARWRATAWLRGLGGQWGAELQRRWELHVHPGHGLRCSGGGGHAQRFVHLHGDGQRWRGECGEDGDDHGHGDERHTGGRRFEQGDRREHGAELLGAGGERCGWHGGELQPGCGVWAGNGALSFNADGSYTFTPGTDFDALAVGATRNVSFTYTAADNDGGVSAAKTVTITVTRASNAPIVTVTVSGTAITQPGSTTQTTTDAGA